MDTNNPISLKLQQYKNFLFHGSSKKIDGVILQETSEDGKIYASNEFDYAAFLAIIQLDEGGSASVNYNEKSEMAITISRGFVNGNSKLVKGYVYVIEKKHFTDIKGNEWFSDAKEIKIIDEIEVDPSYFDGKIIVQGD